MFENLTPAAPDAILGLVAAFQQDPREAKVNLTVGIYQDDRGRTPVLECIKQAEAAILDEEETKSYLPIQGNSAYGRYVRELLLGDGDFAHAATLQTPGGTCALRVVADFLAGLNPGAAIWTPSPTWPNHPQVFNQAGLTQQSYPYLDERQSGLDRTAFFEAIEALPKQQYVVVHGCCHNPSGVDLSADDWRQLAEILHRGQHLPIIDIAYQGYGDGLEADAAGARTLVEHLDEVFLCNSFSKIFSLYRERVGGLTFAAKNPATVESVFSRLKRCVRANYSNPPSHGAATVTHILNDATLRSMWQADLNAMRNRIRAARGLLVDAFAQHLGDDRYASIADHRGMFSLLGLTPEQVDWLRDEKAIYLVRNSRINVAAITTDNVDSVTQAIAAVL